jgi:hypothetical protein
MFHAKFPIALYPLKGPGMEMGAGLLTDPLALQPEAQHITACLWFTSHSHWKPLLIV